MVFFVISCDKKLVFDEYKSVGNSWHQDSILTFKLPKLESEKKYNLYVNVRDNNDYPFDNLFLITLETQCQGPPLMPQWLNDLHSFFLA